MQNLNELRDRIHAGNAKWWTDLETGERIERNRFELLALVVSELSEALEFERKGGMDHHLAHRLGAEVECADFVVRLLDYAGGMDYDLTDSESANWLSSRNYYEAPDNKGEAIYQMTAQVLQINDSIHHYPGDVISRCIWMAEDYCLKHGYDLWGALEEKVLYNQYRADHQLESRRQEGGKKF